MSRRKEREVITCDLCDEEITFVHGKYSWQPWAPSVHLPAGPPRSWDFCSECHDRIIPALQALREPPEPKMPWYRRIFR